MGTELQWRPHRNLQVSGEHTMPALLQRHPDFRRGLRLEQRDREGLRGRRRVRRSAPAAVCHEDRALLWAVRKSRVQVGTRWRLPGEFGHSDRQLAPAATLGVSAALCCGSMEMRGEKALASIFIIYRHKKRFYYCHIGGLHHDQFCCFTPTFSLSDSDSQVSLRVKLLFKY